MSSERRDARGYHTRAGWWFMTHERGGSILIGVTAVLVLAGDVSYVVVRWSTAFGAWFLIAFAAVALAGLLDRFVPRSGAGYRAEIVGSFVVIGALIWIPSWTGGSDVAVLAGLVAAVGSLFVVSTLMWLRARRV